MPFDKVGRTAIDLLESLEQEEKMIDIIGLQLSYILAVYYEPDSHSDMLLYLIENVRSSVKNSLEEFDITSEDEDEEDV